MATASRKTLDWLLLGTANLTVAVMVNWEHHTGDVNLTVALISGLASLVILNAVIITAIHFRYKKHGKAIPQVVVLGTIGLALFSAAVTAIGLHSIPERNDYVALAFSSIPLEQIHPERKALLVELLRKRAANSRDYENVAAQIKPISPRLYSVNSFANESVIRSISDEYKKDSSIDFAYHDQQSRAMDEFRNKMMKVDPGYLRSFEANRQEQEMREAKSFQLQQECVAATLALYDYADTNAKDIAVKDGRLRFADDSVRTEFSRQLEKSTSLYKQWQDSLQELNERQQRLRKDLGLGPNSFHEKAG